MLQGKPVEFSDFHRFAAIYCSKRKLFFLGEGDLLFGNFFLVANVGVRENRHHQIYDMGKHYPKVIRENVLDLHNNGLSKLYFGRNTENWAVYLRVSSILNFVLKTTKKKN